MRFPGAARLELTWIPAAALLMIALQPMPARAWFEESDVGARAAGFGRAFAAVADDPSALYWNPAGLSRAKAADLVLTYSRPYSIAGLTSNYAAVSVPTRVGGAGFSLHHLGVGGAEHEDMLSAGVGREIFATAGGYRVALGAAVKLARVSFPSYTDPDNGQIVDFGSSSKLTGDLGVLVDIPGNWTAGLTLRNLGAPEFKLLEGTGGGTELPTLAQAGLAFKWNAESTVAFDYQQNRRGKGIFNLGGEIWFYNAFAIRAAITSADAGGGFSIKARHFDVDMAFLTSEPLGASYRLGLNVPLRTSR